MFRQLLAKWTAWLGDSDLERNIRDELVRQGYPRHASKIVGARMVAIERPGWVQVWEFGIETHLDGEPVTLYGAARDDDRYQTEVVISHDPAPVNQRLDDWSEGLIVRRRR